MNWITILPRPLAFWRISTLVPRALRSSCSKDAIWSLRVRGGPGDFRAADHFQRLVVLLGNALGNLPFRLAHAPTLLANLFGKHELHRLVAQRQQRSRMSGCQFARCVRRR